MNILRNIYFAILAFALASCGDELNMPSFGGIEPDGTVDFTFTIPDATVVETRADADPESKVNSITVLVFKGTDNNAVLLQTGQTSTPVFIDGNRYKASFKLDDNVKKEEDLSFLFIANYSEPFNTDDNASRSDVTSIISNSVGTIGNLTLCGESTLSNLFSNDISLFRNAVKVTVTDAEASPSTGETAKEYTPGETLYQFDIFGTATESPLFAALSSDETGNGIGKYTATGVFPANIDKDEARYIHPVANPNGEVFTIVKANYAGTYYYYRLDFKKVAGSSTEQQEEYIHLLPNHWCQIIILGVNGPGYPSPEEASRHPESMIEYHIHDHAPAVYNMITDGIRELGVTHEIVYNGKPTLEQSGNTKEKIYIKFYSRNENETSSLTAEDVKNFLEIPSNGSWLNITGIKEVTGNADIAGGSGSDSDPNHTGRVFECELDFNKTDEQGTLNTDITVSWMGLSRKIPVTWVREFNGAELCSVKLIIRNADSQELNTDNNHITSGYTISDYWEFLEGESTIMLHGITPDQNNGKVRNQGLHFPVMYGERGNDNEARWSYAYEIDMTALKEYDFDWSLSVKEDDPALDVLSRHVEAKEGKYWQQGNYKLINNGFSGKHKADTDLVFTITRPGNALNNSGTEDESSVPNDYKYSTGKLIISITPKTDGQKTQLKMANEYSIDLYHTGFFHKDSQSHRVDDNDASSYYYYEVVPIMGASHMRYWLDRNLGAKSSGMYIEATGGTAYYGDKDAAGGYFKVAWKGGDYTGPQMYDNGTDRVSPPGYRVPKQKVWDAMKNSDNFHTESIGAHYSSYYDTQQPAIGNVYFPKAMIRIDGSSLGESRTGYYWTQTEATGTEKEEIGRWLKMFMISGNSTSYINGNIETYAASVRCINDIPDDTELQRTNFNVSGATHVYLYTESKDAQGNTLRTPTTVWPGHAIGNYATMQAGWFNFVLESADFNPDELYVIFNFIDSDGIIHTMSKSANGPTVSTDKSPSALSGWKVTNDDQLDTRLGHWWKCDFTERTIGHSNTRIIGNRTIYIVNSPWGNNTRTHYWGGVDGSDWKNLPPMNADGNKFSAVIPDDSQYVIFRNANNENDKTEDIPLSPIKSTYDYNKKSWID